MTQVEWREKRGCKHEHKIRVEKSGSNGVRIDDLLHMITMRGLGGSYLGIYTHG